MALVSKTFVIDIVPGKTPPNIYVSERDVGRAYYVSFSDDGRQYQIPSGTTAKIEGSIGQYGFSENAIVANDTVIFILSAKMTAIKGKVWTKIKLSNDDSVLSTCAFWLNVDKAGSIAGEYIDPPICPDSEDGEGLILDGFVQYKTQQLLTVAEKAQARHNIGAGKSTVAYNSQNNELTIMDAESEKSNTYLLASSGSSISYIDILDDGSMEYKSSPINCEDIAEMARSGATIIGRFDYYGDKSFIYPLYLTNINEQGAIEFAGFFWGPDNVWSICQAYCEQGDMLSLSYIPVIDYTFTVNLNSDGSIRGTSPSRIFYDKIKSFLNQNFNVCLLVTQDGTRTRIYVTEQMSTASNAPIIFAGPIRHANGDITEAVFLLDSSNNLTVSYTARENALHKVTNLDGYYASDVYYPSVKGAWNTFQRKPVTIWEVNGTTVTEGLKALQTDIAETINWQLTGLDLTPFKRIKVYAKGGQGRSNAGTTGAMILEMSLDSRMGITTKAGHFVGSTIAQKPNDANRYASLTCAVSADKTSFAVLRQTSLYGTAATTNNDIGADVILIEGYYD